MKSKKLFFIFLLIIFNISMVKASIPDWYEETLDSDDTHFYGIGDGSNMNEAILTALENIRNQITFNNDELRINFPNYEIEKVDKDGKHFYILLSIAKSELFNQQIKDLEEVNNIIKNEMNFIKDKNDYIKIVKLNKISRFITIAKNKAETIKLIGKFDEKKYINLYNSIEIDKNDIIKDFKLKLVILDSSLINLKEHIYKLLEKNNIEISDESDNILYIDSLIKKEEMGKKFFVNMILRLKLVCKGKLVNYNSYIYESESDSSFYNAIESCIEKFKNDIESNDIGFLYDK